ncbi:MAG: hypothetical protein ACRDSR_17620 [Pseudonocardiaceae bacterium]
MTAEQSHRFALTGKDADASAAGAAMPPISSRRSVGPRPCSPPEPGCHRPHRPLPVSGDQPEPAPESTADAAVPNHAHQVAGRGDPVPEPRWARCPTDPHLVRVIGDSE